MSDDIIKNLEQAVPKMSIARRLRTILTTILLAMWIIFMLLVFCIMKLFLPSKLGQFFQIFHRGCCLLFGLNYKVVGVRSAHAPSLFLCNHISYLDIFVLGGVIPGYFIAKSEVASWPVLGWLAKVQNTLFFERNGKRVKSQLSIMSDHFDRKGNLILFPEGTSTEGEHVEPFKPSLLQSVEQAKEAVTIQPVTIAYCRYNGQPMNRTIRDKYAWYGTMPFASHFFGAMTMGKAEVRVIFHEPVKLNDFATRKECAHHCWQIVAAGLQQQLTIIS